MKTRLFLLAAMTVAAGRLTAQVVFTSNQISGTLSFNNSNPAILGLLNAPSNEGMSNVLIQAYRLPDYTYTSTPILPTTSRTSGSYQLTVDADAFGIEYRVDPFAVVGNGRQYYYFTSRTSPPVVAGVSGPVMNFNECVGVVQLNFVNSGGAPVSVTDGRIIGYRTTDYSYNSVLYSIASGATQQRLYVRGGEEHRLDITLYRGTDSYVDRQVHFLQTNVTVACDAIRNINIVIPSAGTFGSITGKVDLLGKFEWFVEGNDSLHYPDYTTVTANAGPFQNERWAALGGNNTTQPSSGHFRLTNVVPSTIDPSSPGYAVSAAMLFGTNRSSQFFRTPGLAWGSNAAVAVSPGTTVNLSNIFEINPGFARGNIYLQGPAEIPGHSSLLRGVTHAGDNDTDGNGIPDAAGTYGVYYSIVGYEGVNKRAAGANYTAAFGYAYGDFDGDFDAGTSSFRGNYELAMGGLKSEPSIWSPTFFALTLSSGVVTNDADYYYNVYTISDFNRRELEVAPTRSVTNDIAYCMSEVTIRFRSQTDPFYSPRVRFYNATFDGVDFQGQAANYGISYGIAYGTPSYQFQATNTGSVVMYLPQGDYTFLPGIVPGNTDSGEAGLESIRLNVPCGQRIAIEPCLQMNLNIPPCYQSRELFLTGSVRSCSNKVTRITYVLNGEPPVDVCTDCGPDPSFILAGVLAPGDNILTVTAYDADGGETSVTGTMRPDVLPPVIQCSPNLTNACTTSGGAVVDYTVTATDNCDGTVPVYCDPPSGSLFPIGTTTVSCKTFDAVENRSECSFTVTVNNGPLTIERAVIVRWGCDGVLQYADDPGGPWTDIPGATNPYCVPASEAHRYYRTRQ